MISRRRFILSGSSIVLATPVLTGLAQSGNPYPFTLGVASGSPATDGCVLWTRLAPNPLEGGGMPAGPVDVRYRVCSDDAMRRTVRDGRFVTDERVGHSVHVVLEGLEPGREYWYQFYLGEDESPIGRTRTSDPSADSVRLAVATCQSYESGFFAAYADMADWAPDCVIHVGDYIYEGGIGTLGERTRDVNGKPFTYRTVRQNNSAEIVTLWDYRNRYALYRLDRQLQAAHAASPWIVAMDDHEVDNNWAGMTPQDPWAQTDSEFRVRRQAAFQAYYEHMPLREPPILRGLDSSLSLYGAYRFGPALVHLLDTRQYRSDQVPIDRVSTETANAMLQDRNRGMLGTQQERWLLDSLSRSDAPFNVLAQQTWFAPFTYSDDPARPDFNMDQWDGYPRQRQRLLDALSDGSNAVVLSGDWHCANAATLHRDPFDVSSPQVGWEFASTSIASHCPWAERVHNAQAYNAHVKHTNGHDRGYLRCSVSQDDWLADFRVVEDPYRAESRVRTDKTFSTRSS
jgi:alkaline phosphatase D